VSSTRHTSQTGDFDGVVIIGSQGALRAGRIILAGLPATFPATVIFDLHRAEGLGVMERMLARGCEMPVEPVADGLALAPSTVYVTRHDRQLLLSGDGTMTVAGTSEGVGHRFADGLLTSAARALGPRLIAVVLSGRLTGGAIGVREVKRLGGRVLVQDPATAEATGMPNAALATGCVDFMLPPDGLRNGLVALCSGTGASELFRVRLNHAVVG
jgi:two-component system, chemotaxis family, protein-glutamate methylesterase/glutaminase